jgi:hypothetical protein
MSILQRAEQQRTDAGDELERAHDGYRVVEPMRPDLRPGESVTWIPEMYCQKCQQPRGVKKCPICGDATVLREDLGEVVLPDLPAGAALNLPLQVATPELPPALELAPEGSAPELAPPAAPPARRRVIDDVTPPPDLELPPEFAALEDDAFRTALGEHAPPPAAESPRPLGRLDRALLERAEQERLEEAAAARSRVLDLAQARRAPPMSAAAGSANGSSSNGGSREPAPSSIFRRDSSRNAGGRTVMQQREIQRELDDGGREVQRTLGRNGRRKSIEDELVGLWEGAKLNLDHWVQMASGFAQAGKTPADAADLADELYMELIRRQRLATATR